MSCFRWLLLGLGLVVSGGALAGADLVEPGELPKLRADQGFLLLAVDTPMKMHSATVNEPGRILGAANLRKLEAGSTHALYLVDAGRLAWTEVRPYFNWKLKLTDSESFSFEVRPGVINYPGDLVVDTKGPWVSDLGLYNRSLPALQWLQTHHPQLLAAHELQYRGHYPDPYPAWYLTLPRPADGISAPAVPQASFAVGALSPELLWQPTSLRSLSLSPDGRFLALHLRPDPQQDRWQIDIIDLAAGQRRQLATSVFPYTELTWSGSDRLVLESGPLLQAVVEVIAMQSAADGTVSYQHVRVARRGSLIHPLPNEPERILFASQARRGELMVHKVDISSQERTDAFHGGLTDRLNRGVRGDRLWLADGSGRLRLALAEEDEEMVWLYGADGEFQRLPDFQDPGFEPHGLSADGSRIFGLSDYQREQRELVELDPASGAIVATLFARPGVDVSEPILGADGQPIGASYYREGRLVSEYFDQRQAQWAQRLQKAFPGTSIDLAAGSADGATQLIWVDASDRPPQLFHFDRKQRTASLVLDRMPQLGDRAWVPTAAMQIEVEGGPIEAFLTLPEGDAPRPLVVFPHGGPIGIADDRHFNPEVQLLAAEGYAVLQVNFRGSTGYGRAFREAGHRNLGKLIEDDIDAAIVHALAHYPLDAQRLCIIGTSYGGYSALISAVRWPDRFRCAVSMAGVSDRLLRFTASDNTQSAEGRSRMVEVFGDPLAESEDLRQHSPLYQHQALTLPILLAHAQRDRRVDPEHTRRLQHALTSAGRPPAVLYLEDEGHVLSRHESQRKLWSAVVGFLREHLSQD